MSLDSCLDTLCMHACSLFQMHTSMDGTQMKAVVEMHNEDDNSADADADADADTDDESQILLLPHSFVFVFVFVFWKKSWTFVCNMKSRQCLRRLKNC